MPVWKLWLHGLVAATISGAASGLGAAAGALVMGDGLVHCLKIAAVAALFAGIIGAAAYLKQSPVPPDWDGQDRRNSA